MPGTQKIQAARGQGVSRRRAAQLADAGYTGLFDEQPTQEEPTTASAVTVKEPITPVKEPTMAPAVTAPKPAYKRAVVQAEGDNSRYNADGCLELRVILADGPYAGYEAWMVAPLPADVVYQGQTYEIGYQKGVGAVAHFPPPWRSGRNSADN